MVPESPRWLLSTGRYAQAEKVIKYIADKNGNHEFSQTFKIAPSEESEESEETVKEETLQSYGLKDLFNRKIVLFTLVQMITWPAVSLGYFGQSHGSGDIFILGNYQVCLMDLLRWRETSSSTTSSSLLWNCQAIS